MQGSNSSGSLYSPWGSSGDMGGLGGSMSDLQHGAGAANRGALYSSLSHSRSASGMLASESDLGFSETELGLPLNLPEADPPRERTPLYARKGSLGAGALTGMPLYLV